MWKPSGEFRWFNSALAAGLLLCAMNHAANDAYADEHPTKGPSNSEFVEALQTEQAKVLGCTKPGNAKDASGYAVWNNARPKADMLKDGSRHGVDNGDTVTVYRVSVAEGWELASSGRVWVKAAC